MPQQLKEINAANSRSRHLIPNKVIRNSTGRVWYRADYELRSLRVVTTLRKGLLRDFLASSAAGERVAIANAVDRLLERERVILGIPLPAAVHVKTLEMTQIGDGTGNGDHTKLATVVEASVVPDAQPSQVDPGSPLSVAPAVPANGEGHATPGATASPLAAS